LGEAYLAAGRPGEAVEAFRAYLVVHPGGDEEAWVYAGAARALRRAGRLDEARAFDETVRRRWPRMAER
jgi:tetratricopeptide (TPR) repeat protein